MKKLLAIAALMLLVWLPIESTTFTISMRTDFTLLILCILIGIIINDKKLNK